MERDVLKLENHSTGLVIYVIGDIEDEIAASGIFFSSLPLVMIPFAWKIETFLKFSHEIHRH